MWQTPNQAGGPPSQGKKKRRSKRLFHIKRMDALCEVFQPGEPGTDAAPSVATSTTVRLVLNDFSLKGAGFFASIMLREGQEIRLTLTEPSKLVLVAKVIWCQEYNLNSHVISKEPFAFRAGVEFDLKTPEESSALGALLEEIQAQHLTQK